MPVVPRNVEVESVSDRSESPCRFAPARRSELRPRSQSRRRSQSRPRSKSPLPKGNPAARLFALALGAKKTRTAEAERSPHPPPPVARTAAPPLGPRTAGESGTRRELQRAGWIPKDKKEDAGRLARERLLALRAPDHVVDIPVPTPSAPVSVPVPARIPVPAPGQWSFSEDYTIKHMQQDGKSFNEISNKIGRPVRDVKLRWFELRARGKDPKFEAICAQRADILAKYAARRAEILAQDAARRTAKKLETVRAELRTPENLQKLETIRAELRADPNRVQKLETIRAEIRAREAARKATQETTTSRPTSSSSQPSTTPSSGAASSLATAGSSNTSVDTPSPVRSSNRAAPVTHVKARRITERASASAARGAPPHLKTGQTKPAATPVAAPPPPQHRQTRPAPPPAAAPPPPQHRQTKPAPPSAAAPPPPQHRQTIPAPPPAAEHKSALRTLGPTPVAAPPAPPAHRHLPPSTTAPSATTATYTTAPSLAPYPSLAPPSPHKRVQFRDLAKAPQHLLSKLSRARPSGPRRNTVGGLNPRPDETEACHQFYQVHGNAPPAYRGLFRIDGDDWTQLACWVLETLQGRWYEGGEALVGPLRVFSGQVFSGEEVRGKIAEVGVRVGV